MSKTLHLVRSLRCFGDSNPDVSMKIVVLEQDKFRHSATRFSSCVDSFDIITSPRISPDAYMNDIYDACKKHGATHFLPVAAPVEAVYDSKLKGRLETDLAMKVLHMDPALCDILDDKHKFGTFLREELKIRSPRTAIVKCNDEVRAHNKTLREEKANGNLKRTMILKNLSYDPIHRLDLFQLPTSDSNLEKYLKMIEIDGNPITDKEPWQLQDFLSNGQEYAAMIVVRSNKLVTLTCCPSSASQLNYVHLEIPSIRAWINDFMSGLQQTEHTLTGQLCFDFMVLKEDGEDVAYPIECNPRVHTQCTIYNTVDVRCTLGALLLENTPEAEDKMKALLRRDYTDTNGKPMKNVFWFYNELFKIVPNSWLFNYNDANDEKLRAKQLMSDIVISKRTFFTLMVYLPAIVVSLVLLLPVIIILYFTRSINGKVEEAILHDMDQAKIMLSRLLSFLENLSHPDECIEGDFWYQDPIPFIAKNHIQVSSRLLASIKSGVEWKKIDFAIGKVVEVGGD